MPVATIVLDGRYNPSRYPSAVQLQSTLASLKTMVREALAVVVGEVDGRVINWETDTDAYVSYTERYDEPDRVISVTLNPGLGDGSTFAQAVRARDIASGVSGMLTDFMFAHRTVFGTTPPRLDVSCQPTIDAGFSFDSRGVQTASWGAPDGPDESV